MYWRFIILFYLKRYSTLLQSESDNHHLNRPSTIKNHKKLTSIDYQSPIWKISWISTPGSGGSPGGPIFCRLIYLESVTKTQLDMLRIFSVLLHSQYGSKNGKCTDDYRIFFWILRVTAGITFSKLSTSL